MKIFLQIVVYPLLASLFCLSFGGFFVFWGFQTVDVKMVRNFNDTISADVTRSHFLGLVRFQNHIDNIKGVDSSVYFSKESSGRGDIMATDIYLYSDKDKAPLMTGAGNTNETIKKRMSQKINEFIRNRSEKDFKEIFNIFNILGWFGLPFLYFGVAGIIYWPLGIIKYLVKKNSDLSPANPQSK